MLILYDINTLLCDAWKEEFKNYPEVVILNIPFEELKCDYAVTAGNSYGWMTGGIDLAVRNHLGIHIQDVIQATIIENYKGCLPVGDYIIVKTGNENIPHLVYAPTMRIPQKIGPEDIFYVFVKMLYLQYYIGDLACCGLGTLTGGISPKECAKQMRLAYEYYLNQENKEESINNG